MNRSKMMLVGFPFVCFCLVASLSAPAAPGQSVEIVPPARHTSAISGLAATPDGRFLVSAAQDSALIVWTWHHGHGLVGWALYQPKSSTDDRVRCRTGLKPVPHATDDRLFHVV